MLVFDVLQTYFFPLFINRTLSPVQINAFLQQLMRLYFQGIENTIHMLSISSQFRFALYLNKVKHINMKLSFVSFVSILSLANGFIFDKIAAPVAPLAELSHFVDAQTDTRLSVGLDIGKPGDISRIAINGLVVDLSKRAPTDHDGVVKMPGAHGPQPSLSGGLRALTTVQEGSFISMAGSEVVKALNGCWEIIWKNGAPSGSMICGFEIDRDYQRNDATLPKGPVYVSFNTWTSDGLKREQEKKDRVTKLANSAVSKKDEELAKMKETNNVVQKALHYFNAMSAAEEYSNQPTKSMNLVPSNDEVVHFEGDMFVSMKGCVWTKDKNNVNPIILGTASMKSVPKEA